jgi:hypothetical protein
VIYFDLVAPGGGIEPPQKTVRELGFDFFINLSA